MSDLITSAEAAKLAGVGTTAIKRWSDSGLLRCVKTAGGHRRFHRRDVEQFLLKAERADAGGEWDVWIDALKQNRGAHAVQALLFEERAQRGSWHAVAEALGGLLAEIGLRWESGRVTVIEEHLMSSVIQRALAAVTESLPVSLQPPSCLLAAVEGEEHTLGLSLTELCLREAGWRAEWGGSHTRVSDIVGRVAAGGITMVALSASRSSTDHDALARIVRDVGDACHQAHVLLVVGGQGAWPAEMPYGRRFNSLIAFYEYALERRLDAS